MSIWSESGKVVVVGLINIPKQFGSFTAKRQLSNKFTHTRMKNEASQAVDKTDNDDELIVGKTRNCPDSKRHV